jgi:hypothetical protein
MDRELDHQVGVPGGATAANGLDGAGLRRSICQTFIECAHPVNIPINNAGIMAPPLVGD